jgi:hypothetical protein
MKSSNVAKNVESVNPASNKSVRKISGTQFKAVQVAVSKAVSDEIPESTTRAVTQTTVFGLKVGERKELLLQVESERLLDARHVELKLLDGAGRRYVWIGTTGEAARLRNGDMVLLKGTAEKQTPHGMLLKHCRVIEVAR